MISRIDISDVVVAHLKTLRRLDKPQAGINGGDIWLFFGLPAVAAILLAFGYTVQLKDFASNLLTAVSIVGGFLFGLLGMISTVIDKVKQESSNNAVKKIYAKEIHANISFGIILSLFCSLALIVYGFVKAPDGNEQPAIQQMIAAFVCYFLLISYFFTLLMIVKRIFVIMSNDATSM